MRKIDTKYYTTGDIIRQIDDSVLPPDEPLILFRGRDKLLLPTLDFYLSLRTKIGSQTEKIALLQAEIDIINQWQKANPDRLRTPK